MPRSRSFTRLTMRVGLLHLGQSVDFVVSISFLRSPVLAILAIGRVFLLLWGVSAHTRSSTARGFNGAAARRPLQTAGLASLSLHQGRPRCRDPSRATDKTTCRIRLSGKKQECKFNKMREKAGEGLGQRQRVSTRCAGV